MIKDSKRNKKNIIIALYTIAFIMGMYTLFTVYNSYAYISDLVSNKGLVISKELTNVISYYMNASMPYVFYTIVIWGIGYIIHKVDSIKIHEVNEVNEVNKENKVIENDINLKKAEQELDSFVNKLKVGKNNLE